MKNQQAIESEELTVTNYGPILITYSKWVPLQPGECRIYEAMPLYAWVRKEVFETCWGITSSSEESSLAP